MQCACAIFSSVAWPAVHSFLINRTIFETKGTEYKMRVSCFSTTFCPKHFSFYEELSDVWWKTHNDLHVKYPLLLSDFNKPWIFFPKKYSKTKFHEIPSSGAPSSSVRTDGQTLTKLTVAFRNSTNAPKNYLQARKRVHLKKTRPNTIF